MYITRFLFSFSSPFASVSLRTRQIGEKATNASANYQLHVAASSIVCDCEALLSMITEMKHLILVNDFDTINENVEGTTRGLQSFSSLVDPELARLRREIDDTLLFSI